tara:strand:- start:19250 stop:19510 length:261 start_codon:yes stop_codon:yes gene_type:complete
MKPVCTINFFGSKCWYLNNKRHREDGPACEWSNGDKEWYLNGKRHRLDGPACEWNNGNKSWWYHDKRIECKDNQEFLRMIKLMIFL